MNSLAVPELVLVEDTYEDEMMALLGISRSGIPCHVTVQRDGAEALSYLLDENTRRPELIVLDFRLPKLNGLEILTQLRSVPKMRHIPIVMVSGTNAGSTLTECYRVGANSCVTKPMDADEYIERLASVTHYWLSVNQASDAAN